MLPQNIAYIADLIRKKPIRTALILGLFLGYMTATAGVAVWPRFARLSSPFVCANGLQLESEHYAIVNGERGVNRHFYCEDAPGEKRGVNFRVMVTTGLVYSGIFSSALIAAFLICRKFLSR